MASGKCLERDPGPRNHPDPFFGGPSSLLPFSSLLSLHVSWPGTDFRHIFPPPPPPRNTYRKSKGSQAWRAMSCSITFTEHPLLDISILLQFGRGVISFLEPQLPRKRSTKFIVLVYRTGESFKKGSNCSSIQTEELVGG